MRRVIGYMGLMALAFLAPALISFWLFDISALYIGWIIGDLLVLLVFLLARFPLEHGGSDRDIIRDLAIGSRLQGMWTMEDADSVTVRASSWSQVEVRRRSTTGSLHYRLEPTPTALSFLLFMTLIWVASPLVPLASMWVLYVGDGFARTRLTPLLEKGALASRPIADDIRTMLMITVSDARQIAMDAYEASRSAYHDLILLTFGILGLVGGVVIFALMVSLHILDDTYYQMILPLALSFVVSMAISALVFHSISQRPKREMASLREWVARLEKAYAREMAGTEVPTGEGTLELLMLASSELPRWLQIRNKGGHRNPGGWLAIFLVSYLSFSALMNGLSLLIGGYLDSGLVFMAVGIGALVATYLLYRTIRKRERAEAYQTLEGWKRRKDLIDSRFERLLEE